MRPGTSAIVEEEENKRVVLERNLLEQSLVEGMLLVKPDPIPYLGSLLIELNFAVLFWPWWNGKHNGPEKAREPTTFAHRYQTKKESRFYEFNV